MIFVAGISIALFISVLLLLKKNKTKSDAFLFLWMIVNASQLFFFYLIYTDGYESFPHLLGLNFPLPLLHGVLLYFYVGSVTNQLPKKTINLLFHLVPALLTFIYLIPFLGFPASKKIEIFKNEGIDYQAFQNVVLIAIFISGIAYVIWSSILMSRHKTRIRNEFSDIDDIDLRWLQFLTYGLGVVWSLVIFTQNDFIIFVSVSIFVILIGLFGVQQKEIFSSKKEIILQSADQASKEVIQDLGVDSKKKYSSSSLSPATADALLKNLNKLMTEKTPYKKPDLSLNDLAKEMEIHPNYISQIINEKENKSFYDYVNTYRIEEFKRLISIPGNQQFTLMAIAYDCGFNSKSSFNRYFKKITNQTPSQFVKTQVK